MHPRVYNIYGETNMQTIALTTPAANLMSEQLTGTFFQVLTYLLVRDI